jgi:hypothetical protein
VAAAVEEIWNLAECEAILRDKNRGMSTSEVCEKWKISQPTMSRRIKAALDANRIDDIVEYREREMAACDDYMDRWQGQLVIAEQMATAALASKPDAVLNGLAAAARVRSEALNGMLRVSERRARLAGADSPVKADVTVTLRTDTDRAIDELLAMMDHVEAG